MRTPHPNPARSAQDPLGHLLSGHTLLSGGLTAQQALLEALTQHLWLHCLLTARLPFRAALYRGHTSYDKPPPPSLSL